VGPVVLDPIFNRFNALPPGRARTDVLELARKAGVKVGQVYEVDASRRTTAANAYVTGLGRTKRVVLYDTLLKRFSPAETNLVVAHELGHVHYRDVPRGLLYLVLVAPAALFGAARLTERWRPHDAPPGAPAMLPAAALALGIVAFGTSIVSNQLSRRVEQRADSYSLRLTNEPGPFISSEKRLAVQNVSVPDPPAWQTFLLATHPPTIERIGTAVAFERGRR
jgi:STE24 endopeptidase